MAKEYQVWSPGRLHELSRIAAMAQEVLPTAILNRDGATLIQPSSCVVLARTCFPSLTATSLEDANLGKFPSDVPARPTPPEGRHQTPLRESVPLEALPASRSLIVLHSCPFLRFVTANNATCRCAKDAMVTGKMARSTAHHRTF
jgi:hypothetical protein